MGGDICRSIPDNGEKGLGPLRDIYLSNPQNITRTQLQRSADFKLSDSTNQFLALSQTSVILGCKQDQNRQLLNKYVLTYLYFLKNKTGEADVQIKDFINLLSILDEQKKYAKEVEMFQSQYVKRSSPRQKSDYLINQYFKNGFFSSAIEQFPVYSADPSIIGYARRPIVDLNKGIKSKYDKQPWQKQIYCVIQVSKDQQNILKKMANAQDYFTFGTFIRCFSTNQKAKKRQKQLQKIGKNVRQTHKINSSTLLFNIQISKEQVDKDYDYGFYKDQSQKDNPLGDIIMNILNFFQVTGAQPQQKTYDLKYNGLARLIHLKRARLLQTQPQLIKVTSLIQGQCQQIKSHSSLIRLVTNRSLSITASQTLKGSTNLPSSSEDNERINLIEAYIEQGNFDKALQQCKDTLQFKVRKAHIYYEAKKYEQAQTILKEIEPSKAKLKNDHFKEYILFQLISVKLKKSKGEKKSAEKQLRTLSEIMKKQYKESYQYRGRQVERQIAECEGVKSSGVNWESYGEGLNIGVMLSH